MTEPVEDEALQAARAGDRDAVGQVLESYRPRLLRMISLRMDTRLRGRFDPTDVLQEAYIEVSERLESYLEETEPMPFFLWVRFLSSQKLLQFHRKHLGVEARAVDREIGLQSAAGPGASSHSVASVWLAESGTPSRAAAADEEHARVRQALEGLSEMDREVLVLRHFEQLSNAEVSSLLEISPQTASARYVRALTRLQGVVGGE